MGDESAPMKEMKVLISDDGGIFGEYLAMAARFSLKSLATVTPIFPETKLAGDILDLAGRERFDLAVFILDHIIYPAAGDENLPTGPVELVREIVRRFGKPVIAFDGIPHLRPENHYEQLVEAGAAAILPLPCPPKKMRKAFRECLKVE